jgi:hypothetical protein
VGVSCLDYPQFRIVVILTRKYNKSYPFIVELYYEQGASFLDYPPSDTLSAIFGKQNVSKERSSLGRISAAY